MKKLLLFFFFSCLAGEALAFATVSQQQYRWRKDDGNETQATWHGDADQKLVVRPNSDKVRLRIQFYVGSTPSPAVLPDNLSFSTSPNGPFTYLPVGANPQDLPFVLVSSSQVSPGTATTRQLSAEAEPFIPGAVLPGASGSAGDLIFSPPLPDPYKTEYEWVIQPTAFVQLGSYYFRLEGLNGINAYLPDLPAMQVVDVLITGQPAAATVTGGETTSFTVQTDEESSALSYQWQQSSDGGRTFTNIQDGGIYSGATTEKLNINQVPISLNNYQYRAEVTKTSKVTSVAATLHVQMPAFDFTHSWVPAGTPGFSADGVDQVSLAFDAAGTAYLAYRDLGNSNIATVRKFNGTDWEQVGSQGFSPAYVQDLTLALSAAGTPYVAYRDQDQGNKATVMKFNGTAWETVGTAGFTANQAEDISLALDPAGTPYLAYRDADQGYKATVMRFNGTAWEPVGTPGFSDADARFFSLALDGTGTPYLAYQDAYYGNHATVMKFNGTSWEIAGAAGFTAHPAEDISLALDLAGNPYLAYRDTGNGNKATVMRLKGAAWETVGAPGFSADAAHFISLALDGAGSPFLAYQDAGNGHKATVMKFNGTGWETLGTAGLTAGQASDLSLALDAAGTPYLAFQDADKDNKATVMKWALVAQVTSVAVPANGTYKVGDELSFTVNYSESVTVNTAAGTPVLGLGLGSASRRAAYTSGSGTSALVFSYTIQTGDLDTDGIALESLGLEGGTIRSAGGINANNALVQAGAGDEILVDGVAPQLSGVSIASNNALAARAKPGDVVTLSFTASEALASPTATIAGQPATISAISASQYTAAYTLTGSEAEGTVAFRISFSDAIGNAGTAVTETTNASSVVFDKTAPDVLISSAITNLTNVSPIPFSITFPEAVSGLVAADFTTTNGAVSNIQTADNIAYTASFTPAAEGPVSVSLAAGKAADAAGNGNTASTAWRISYDSTSPTVALSSSAAALLNGPFSVTFTFSEAVTGFEAADIVVSSGTAGNPVAVSATVFTALIQPAAQGEVRVQVAANAVADAAGNSNPVSTLLNRTYDTVAPAGYALAFNQQEVNFTNQQAVSLQVSGAESGAVYFYAISSAGGGTPLTGTATAAAANFALSGLNLTALADGRLTARFYQRDAVGNQGAEVTASVSKLTRNILAFTPVAEVVVPIRTSLAQVTLPALVEVTYSDQTKQQIPVSWSAGTYNGLVAGTYELIGVLSPAPGTANLNQVVAKVRVVVEPNKAPAGLALSQTSFKPEIAANEAIGTFSATDADDNQHSYTLVSGAGSSDNALFEVRGNQLFLLSNKGLSGKTSFSVRVRATDPYQNTFEQAFPLSKQAYAKAAADLKIVNTFSPNGDGINDTWIIPELRFYNNVEVEIFDRSGKRQFYSTNPGLGWDGKADSGLELKGAVLYIVRIQDINLVKKGVVTILRK